MFRLFRIVLFFTFFFGGIQVFAQSGINRNSFFNAMASTNVATIDAQLKSLKSLSGSDKEAFEGALLMRKSATLTVPAKKLAMFKDGYKKLETAIGKNPGNAEYRFLRLMVQENAPRSLGYYKNISQDSKIVKNYYKSLPAVTQSNLVSYSKKSKALSGAF